MGKPSYFLTDSDETENTSSSVEYLKKKKNPSILKYTTGNVKKKKCKIHSKSEPDDSDYRSSQSLKYKLRGILKHDRDRDSSDDDEESEPPPKQHISQHKYLVGQVPRSAGSKPGRGGGVAIIVRKSMKTDESSFQAQQSSTINTNKTKKKSSKRLTRKRSY